MKRKHGKKTKDEKTIENIIHVMRAASKCGYTAKQIIEFVYSIFGTGAFK